MGFPKMSPFEEEIKATADRIEAKIGALQASRDQLFALHLHLVGAVRAFIAIYQAGCDDEGLAAALDHMDKLTFIATAEAHNLVVITKERHNQLLRLEEMPLFPSKIWVTATVHP